VPQYILEQAIEQGVGVTANIICTQPRRLPAVALASRVSDEIGQPCGGVVGYSVRLNKKLSRDTRLMFCTTGILLRRLVSDPALRGVSHVIIDEVHERSLDSDLLMLLLRDTLVSNTELRLVLMSATADPGLFVRYFDTALASCAPQKGVVNKCAVVEIPGFTYPVRELALEDALDATGALDLLLCSLQMLTGTVLKSLGLMCMHVAQETAPASITVYLINL
jgi:ATP-dependent RNA helicase DHX57